MVPSGSANSPSTVCKDVEHIPVTIFGALKYLDLSDRLGGKIPHGGLRVIKERFGAGRKNVVVAIHPSLPRQRVGGEHLVAGAFRDGYVVLHGLHVRIAGAEEVPYGVRSLRVQPRQ